MQSTRRIYSRPVRYIVTGQHEALTQSYSYGQSLFVSSVSSDYPTRTLFSTTTPQDPNESQHSQFKKRINALYENGHSLLFRADSRAAMVMKNGLSPKGNMTDLALHVKRAPYNSNYIATSCHKSMAARFGYPPYFQLIHLTPPTSLAIPTRMPIVLAYLNQFGGPPSSLLQDDHSEVVRYALSEAETAVAQIKESDIVGIETRLRLPFCSLPLPQYTYYNPNHTPAAVVTEVLSHDPAQAEEWEIQLKNIGHINTNERFLKMHEVREYGISDVITDIRQPQLVINTIPGDVPERLVQQFLKEKHRDHLNKFKKRLDEMESQNSSTFSMFAAPDRKEKIADKQENQTTPRAINK